MIGFHIQNSPENYLRAVEKLPAGTPVKFTSGWERAIEVKQTNPWVTTWARHVVPQPFVTSNYEKVAQDYFRGMVDINAAHWRHMDFIQGWNEFYANSQEWDEKKHWAALDIAFAKVWHDEYRPIFPDIRYICSEPGVGNDIPWQVAKAAVKYDALLGYHPYIPVYKGELHPHDEWPYYSGRWDTMDARYRERGIHVDWIFGEMGPYQSAMTGWRHPDVLNRDMGRYKAILSYWMAQTVNTVAYKDGRVYGGVLFTCGAPGSGPNWKYFDHDAQEMTEIGVHVAAFMANVPEPVDPIPPPPPEPDPEPPLTPQIRPPRVDYARTVHVIPDGLTTALESRIFAAARVGRETVGWSYDDAGLGAGLLSNRKAILWEIPQDEHHTFLQWYEDHYPGTSVEFRYLQEPDAPTQGVFVDVSRWQGVIDWDQAKRGGVTDAYIKATQGAGWIDPMLQRNVSECMRVGIRFGLYHFWENDVNGTLQNALISKVISDLPIIGSPLYAHPFALDVEEQDGKLEPDELLYVARQRPSLIYTARYVWEKLMGEDGPYDEFLEFPLWVADYTQSRTVPRLPRPWSEYYLWQYGIIEDGSKYGVNGALDMNRRPA